jgi:hypothetical protein
MRIVRGNETEIPHPPERLISKILWPVTSKLFHTKIYNAALSKNTQKKYLGLFLKFCIIHDLFIILFRMLLNCVSYIASTGRMTE